MQIGGFPSGVILGACQNGAAKNPTQSHGMCFDLMLRNEQAAKIGQTDKIAAPAPLTPEAEMFAFKLEIYRELAEIDSMNSSAVLSNSVHVTEDGFKRMKEDPAYRKEIMDWLRADARASYGLPFGTHVTTTITGHGATSYGASDDLYQKDPATRTMFDQKEKNAFYHSKRANRAYADRKAIQRKKDNEYVINELQKRKLIQKMMLEKSISQSVLRQENSQQGGGEQYLEGYYMMGMQPPVSWNI